MKNLLIILVISILYTNLFGLTPNESITLVDPFECNCDDPSNQFIIDGRIQGGINISSFNFNNSIEDKCIIIAGQLNIDQDFIMNSWDVKMEPGAKIVVKTGKKLKVTASSFVGCTKLWHGIVIENNAALEIGANSLIKDAQYAIEIKGECELNCFQTSFLNDYIGIYAGGENVKLINGFPIGYCTFESTTLKPAYSGSEIGEQLYSLAGIFLNKVVDFSVGFSFNFFGYPIIMNNSFSRLRNGIINVGSGVNVQYTSVSNTQRLFDELNEEVFSDPYRVSGVGFYSKNNIYSNISECITNTIDLPVFLLNSNAEIKSNEFKTDVNPEWLSRSRGIVIRKGDFKKIEISENWLNKQRIYITDVKRPFSFDIYKNKVIAGFYVENSDYINIYDNPRITEHSWIWDANDMSVLKNFFGDTKTPFKIWVRGGGSNYFYDNDFLNDNNPPNCGYFVVGIQGSDENILKCNRIGEFCNLLEFYGTNFDTDLRGNTFFEGTKSISIIEGEIGDQPYKGNVFHGNSIGYIEGSDPISIASKSPFIYNPSDPPQSGALKPSDFVPANIEGYWFIPENKKLNYDCLPYPGGGVPPKPDPWWVKLSCDSLKIFLEKALFTTIQSRYSQTFLWYKQRYYYKKLLEYPELRRKCRFVDSLLTVLNYKRINKYIETDMALKNAYMISDTDIGILNNYGDGIKSLKGQIHALDSLLVMDTLNTVNELLQKKLLLDQLKLVEIDYTNKIKNLSSAKDAKLATVLVLVNSLDYDTDYEYTQKRFWQLYLKENLTGKQSLSEAEWAEIRNMAEKCPLEYGKVIYSARTMYLKYDSDLEFNDDLCAYKTPIVLRNDASDKSNIIIYPNPTSNEWNIEIDNPGKTHITIELVDLGGNLIRSYDYGSNIKIHDNMHLEVPSGIFFAKVYRDDVLVDTKKLIKLK